MKTPPDRLRLIDGELALKDGGDVRDYLRDWAKRNGIDEQTSISLMPRELVIETITQMQFFYAV